MGPTVTVGGGGEITPGVAERRDLAPGSRLHRYVILHEVGAGAMGVVYKAYDPDLDRPVALKILSSASRDGQRSAVRSGRLLREAQGLAKVTHPNVVAVHDVGTYGEDVFIAMEFIEGRSLRDWCREATPTDEDIRRAFVSAGEGLAAAHRAGLVHRDFKPDNVMMGRDGRVRVLDFGLVRGVVGSEGGAISLRPSDLASSDSRSVDDFRSKGESSASSAGSRETAPAVSARDAASAGRDPSAPLTVEGAILGTPRYMAPEQRRGGEVDARCDQFSFCVSLHEALCGQTPFASGAASRRKGSRRRREAPELDPRIPAWMRPILKRGLSVDPDERYPTMEALLVDLRRDPRAARRGWLASGAAFLMVVGAVAGLRYAKHKQENVCRGGESKLEGVWDGPRKKAVERAFVATGRDGAKDEYGRVARALDAYTEAWVTMRTEACEATRVRGEQSDELLDLRMECLGTRLDEVRTQVDLFEHADGAVVGKAAQAAQALTRLDACADIASLRAPIRPPKDAATREAVAEIRRATTKAKVLDEIGRWSEGVKLTSDAVRRARQLGYGPVTAEALFYLGKIQDSAGDYKASERALREAHVTALASRHDEMLAQSSLQLVWALGEREGRYEEGRAWADIADAALVRVDRSDLRGRLLRYRGVVAYREGKYEEALALAKQALALVESFSTVSSEISNVLSDIGDVYNELERYDESLAYYERSLAVIEQQLGPDHPHAAAVASNISIVLDAQGKYERATEFALRALHSWERSLGPEHPWIAGVLHELGEIERRQGKLDSALEKQRRALAIWEKALGPSHPSLVNALMAEGVINLTRGRASAAVPPLERARVILEANPGDGIVYASVLFHLARSLWAEGRERPRATDLARKARDAYGKEGDRGREALARVDAWLAHPGGELDR